MLILLEILEWLLPIGYAGIAAAYVAHFFDEDEEREERESVRFRGSIALFVALCTHLLYFLVRGLSLQVFPLGSKGEFLSWMALSIGAVYALTEQRERESQTGMFFLVITFLFQFAASLLMQDTHVPSALDGPVLSLHMVFTMLGFAGLAVGALYAAMYVLLSRQLKSHDLGVFFRRLPPLMKLESLSKTSTIAGVLLLGFGLALGHYVAMVSGGLMSFMEPKIIVADSAWLVYFVGLVVVRWRGLAGMRMARVSLAGFLVLMASMALTSAVSTGFHAIQ